MIKNKKSMFLVISVFTLVLFLGGVTYAWFTYRSESSNQRIIAGNIYLVLDNGQEQISLTSIFPESVTEARARNDNYITFEIQGVNEADKTLYYEIDLNHGTDKSSPKIRFDDKDLRFDLVELDSNDDEVRYILNAVSYDTLVNKRIYADSIDANTSTEVSRKYKLRMWLTDDVIVSDSDPNANYPANGFSNYYANIKLTVAGDFNEKYFGYQKVLKAVEDKQNAQTNACNPTWTDTEDGIIYFSGTNDCVDMNYVWYSGKLWRITAIYPDGAMKLITENMITSIVFNESEQVNFYTDENTTSYEYQWLNEDFYDTLYNANNIIDNTKQWDIGTTSIISSKPSESVNISANVGLLNSYEYYNSYRNTNVSSGYLNNNYSWWLLNPYSASNSWHVENNGFSSNSYTNSSYGSRPSIVIKTGLEFTGEGNNQSPYKIVGDKETGATNELINTRISGEYIKLVNSSNSEQYQIFRIIGIEDNKTKIIAMDYADNNATKQFATSIGSANALWGSGTTTDTGTWYTYLNAPTTGYFDTLKSTYGDYFDSATYYLGTSGYNYKLGVCANTTSGNTKVCDKTSDVGTFNIGLPRYGEMFATQQSGGYSNSIKMILINRHNSSNVEYVGVSGSCNYLSPTSTYAARPTVHLKSTVKILSGTGLPDDPYVVGL